MTTPATQEDSTIRPSSAFAHKAAKGSPLSVAIVILLVVSGNLSGAVVPLELIALVFMIGGFLLGASALFGVRKHGAKGILTRAVRGVIIHGLLLFIFTTNFIAARTKAKKAERLKRSQTHQACNEARH